MRIALVSVAAALLAALSLQMGQPLLYVRPRRSDAAEARVEIEGIYRPGQTALVVDDLAENREVLRRALENEGWPVREVARALNVSVANVYVTKHRISRLIQHKIKELS